MIKGIDDIVQLEAGKVIFNVLNRYVPPASKPFWIYLNNYNYRNP